MTPIAGETSDVTEIDAGALAEQAAQAHAAGDWARAADAWDRLCVQRPEDPHCHSQAAVARRELGDRDGAEQAASRLVERFPGFLGGGIVWADLATRRGDHAEASRRWALLQERFPNDATPYCEGARALQAADQADAAERLMQSAQSVFPTHQGVAFVWAELAMRRSSWAEAVRRWTLMQARWPDFALAPAECARALHKSGDGAAARLVLGETAERFPDQERPLHDLARLAEEAGDWAEVESAWTRYLERFPPVWFGYAGLANALRRQGRAEEAESVLTRARQALPNEPGATRELARFAEQRGDWSAAAGLWAEYRALRPDDWDGYTGEAYSLRQRGLFDPARALLEAALARLPHAAMPRHELARLAEETRDWAAAEAHWAEYRRSFPPIWISFAGGAQALRHLSRTAEAEALFQEAIARFPNELGPVLGLVDMHGATGRWSDAMAVIDAALARHPDRPELLAARADLAMKNRDPKIAFAAWDSMPDATPEQVERKLNLAREILRIDPNTDNTPDLLGYLATEQDTLAVDWAPRAAAVLHALVLMPEAPWPALRAFFDANHALFENSPHRLLWIAALDIPPTAADVTEIEDRVLRPGRFGLASYIYSTYVLNNRKAWREAVLDLLSRRLRARNEAEQGTVLALAAGSMHLPDDFWTAIAELRDQPLDGEGDAAGVLVRLVRAASRADRISGAPAIVQTSDRPLRIAVCVSGQLRGYKQAFASWATSGLWRHETRIFVHSWKNVGLNWMRNWDFFRTTHPGAHAVLSRADGPALLASCFPTLAAAANDGLRAEATATEAGVSAFYQTDAVVLEDDALPPFAGRPNDWKMLYKIQQAHNLATASGDPFDLILRIRPDVQLGFGAEVDFHAIAHESRRDHRLFLDSPVLFTFPDGKLKAGDQLAIGAPGPMQVYADTVDFDPTLAAVIGAPPTHKAHETLGTSLFARGVTTGAIPGLRGKNLLNPAVLTPARVAELARQDAHPEAAPDFCRQLLEACALQVEQRV